jgi:hypothetical protein
MEFDSQVRLGRGDFGSVFPGTFEGREAAIRRIELIDASDNEEEALKQLDHPNIIKFLGVKCSVDFKYDIKNSIKLLKVIEEINAMCSCLLQVHSFGTLRSIIR